jgi:PAS domain S-box-containing protein
VLKRGKAGISPVSLRERAEAALGASRADIARMSPEEIKKLVHELQVHQIELELQNEELRQSQLELAESRDRFNDLYDIAPVGYVTLGDGAKILQTNLTAASMLGVARRHLIGRRFTSFVTRDAQDNFYFYQRAAVETRTKQTGELLLKRSDGILLPVHLETICAQDPLTGIRHWRSTISDISALKQAEEALRQSHAELEKRVRERTAELSLANETLRVSEARKGAMLNASLDGIITIEHSGQILDFNPAAEKIFGYQCGEILGNEMLKLIAPPALQSPHWRDLERYLTTGEGPALDRRIEVTARRRDGSEFPIELAIARIGDQWPPLFISFVRDITARRRAQAELEARTRQESAVAALSRQALIGRDLGWLLREATVVLTQVLGAEFSKVLELMPGGHELLLRAGVGWSEGCVGVSRIPARGDSQASYTLQRNEPILVEDWTKETRFPPAALLLDHSVVSGISVVIHGRSQPYGILSVHTARKRCFNVHEVHFLQSISDVLAEAIMRRQLEEELLAISNREQLRIGHDLHDGLCQQLAGIEFRAVVLAGKLTGNPEAQQEAESIGGLLRDSMQDARILSQGLAPVDLEANGLMSALDQVATSCGQLYGVDWQFRYDRLVLIGSRETATHLYRIAQEAINNAIKHGHAKTIVIGLRHAGAETLLTVTNDGLPFPSDTERRGGMGLQIMRYRADVIGATLRIESMGDGKTAMVCSFKPADR